MSAMSFSIKYCMKPWLIDWFVEDFLQAQPTMSAVSFSKKRISNLKTTRWQNDETLKLPLTPIAFSHMMAWQVMMLPLFSQSSASRIQWSLLISTMLARREFRAAEENHDEHVDTNAEAYGARLNFFFFTRKFSFSSPFFFGSSCGVYAIMLRQMAINPFNLRTATNVIS